MTMWEKLRSRCVRAEPTTVAFGMLITGREHIVFLAQPPSIRFRHTILGKQADVFLLIQSGKALWFVRSNAHIAAGVIRLSLMVLAERRHFHSPDLPRTSRPDKPRSALHKVLL